MSSQILDFLTDSFLFNDTLLQSQFSEMTELEIQKELDRYRDFCLSKQSEIEREALIGESNLNVMSDLEMPDLNLLKQSAFYINKYIINDPLFSIGNKENGISKAMKSYLGVDSKNIDKIALTKILTYFKKLAPMVAADYVKILPINHFLETPKELPILHSENGFSDVIPDSLIDFFRDNVEINSLERVSDNPNLIELKELKPSREIIIDFKEHTGGSYGYTLFASQFDFLDEDTGEFKAVMTLPDKPPDSDDFINWVNQSFYLSCKQVYDEALWRNFIANKLGALYLTESPFVFELLKQSCPIKNNISTATTNILLNIELPFLEKINISTLMKIRKNDGEAFQDFRLYLEKQFRELRLVKDRDELQLKAENTLHELSDVQIRAIDQKVGQIKKDLAFDTVVLVGGLLAAIQTGPLSIAGIAAVATAGARGAKTFVDYSSQLKQNPAFFLWQVLKKSSKKAR